MTTLEDAIALGRGIERPFRCHEHDDTSASASVNVVKNVWFCYACHAKGTVDGKRVPTVSELEAMLEPEKACRHYPSSWLDLYTIDGAEYWRERFPDWLCWWGGLGQDPWTGEATYPVHTPRGRLAGVARRAVVPGPGPKYRYPAVWAASRTLWGSRGVWTGPRTGILVLVEGAADALALWECGIPAWACYGAGLHQPQLELVVSLLATTPRKLVLTGFDMDDAGERATDMTERMLRPYAEVAPITWPAKDPADTERVDRIEACINAVTDSTYGRSAVDDFHDLAVHIQTTIQTEHRRAA